MRTQAKNSVEKDFFFFFNDSVFGKTMKNRRKGSNVSLVTDEEVLLKVTAKQTYVSSKTFNKNLVAVKLKLKRLKMDRPSYVGMRTLDFSKTIMYDFHYNYIKNKYDEN